MKSSMNIGPSFKGDIFGTIAKSTYRVGIGKDATTLPNSIESFRHTTIKAQDKILWALANKLTGGLKVFDVTLPKKEAQEFFEAVKKVTGQSFEIPQGRALMTNTTLDGNKRFIEIKNPKPLSENDMVISLFLDA